MSPDKTSRHDLVVTPPHVGRRLDSFIAARLPEISRSYATRLIKEGRVLVNGAPAKPSRLMRSADRVEVIVPLPIASSVLSEQIELDVIYEDKDIIVVNKPAGMVVHPAAGRLTGTLVNALLSHCKDLSGIGGELKPGIVHRLDLGTSGVIVAAKNDTAHNSLAAQFKARAVQKIYNALVIGKMKMKEGYFDSEIGRSSGDRKRFSSRTKKGRAALTLWRVVEDFGGILNWLEIQLKTGRTHQIRVHFAESGHPLVGDPLYGGRRKADGLPAGAVREAVKSFGRPVLHARCLGFSHPGTGKWMEFTAPLPSDIEGLLKVLEKALPQSHRIIRAHRA